jgi:hypothetical protein
MGIVDAEKKTESNSIESDEEGDFEDWQDALEEGQTQCLFDELVFISAELCDKHMKEDHGFDFLQSTRDLDLDFYDRIKLINFIRHQHCNCICFSCKEPFEAIEHLSLHIKDRHEVTGIRPLPKSDAIYSSVKFMFPFHENDPLLMYYDDDDDDL